MSKVDEMELAYVHIPIFYNAKLKTENETNTIQETREFTNEEDIFGNISIGMLMIIMIILICCILILHILQEKEWL